MIELPVLQATAQHEEQPTTETKFWRSLSHLRGTPAFKDVAKREFMEGALDAPSGQSRRSFLQLMGASIAMAGLAACRRPVETILPYSRKPEETIPGVPMQYATAMPFRGTVQALLVESSDGRPTKVEGNPQHPISQGASTVFQQASVLNLYDPDRSQMVLEGGETSSWRAFATAVGALRARAGSLNLAVMAPPTSSPTMARMRSELESTFPNLRWVTYSAEGNDNAALGMQQAFGRAVRPLYKFSQADVIVSLDADFLGATSRTLTHDTREFAMSRRRLEEDGTMSRLYVVESRHTTTGGMADHRQRLRSSEIPALAAALASAMGMTQYAGAGATLAAHPMVQAMARDLSAAGSRGVVLAGESQPPAVHALCAAINSQLGAVGTTVQLLDPGTQAEDQETGLRTLVAEMSAGRVGALLMLGVNPVYSAPADLNFVNALGNVAASIHLGLHVDETAMAAGWHLPQSHYLEAWGDGRAYDGTLSVIQPLIAPLYDTRSDLEVLSLFNSGVSQSGYDLVRSTWQPVVSGDFEAGWRSVVHDGFLSGTGFAAVTGASASAPANYVAPVLGVDDVELVFDLDSKVLDGSFANNAWMQELPDPSTKLVWDNVALMSPATAERLGLSIELDRGKYYVDRVRLTVGTASVELPAWIMPGMADGTIALSLGYGRTIATNRETRDTSFFDVDDYTDVYGKGAIGTEVGQNVAPLRPSGSASVVIGAQVERVADTYMLASTQDHGVIDAAKIGDEATDKRGLYRMATLREYQADPAFVDTYEMKEIQEPWDEYPPLWEERHPTLEDAYRDSPYFKNQWAMVIDLNTCTGCNACIIACQSENNIQVVGKEEVARGRELHWLRIDRYFVTPDNGDTSSPMMAMQPVPCMHCENAPCESVCPVAATVHSPDGTNQMIYNRCIGTRYCANNCPYKVRRFNFFNWTKTLPIQVQMAHNPNVSVRFRGVMEKCSYCIQRVREVNKRTSIEDNRPIRDGEVQTACQQACPAGAIVFGDMADPTAHVVQQQRNNRNYAMLPELNVKPRTTYLGRITNPNPALEQV